MTRSITCSVPTPTPTPAPNPAPVEAATPTADGALEGWQLLATATLGRVLTQAELAACERLPTELGLDLLFPGLDDAARHEALSMIC